MAALIYRAYEFESLVSVMQKDPFYHQNDPFWHFLEIDIVNLLFEDTRCICVYLQIRSKFECAMRIWKYIGLICFASQIWLCSDLWMWMFQWSIWTSFTSFSTDFAFLNYFRKHRFQHKASWLRHRKQPAKPQNRSWKRNQSFFHTVRHVKSL